jgi:hypothetical protein
MSNQIQPTREEVRAEELMYQNLGIEATRDLELLHRELLVHENWKRSRPLDPNHQGSLDLIQEIMY